MKPAAPETRKHVTIWKWMGCDFRSVEDWKYYLGKMADYGVRNILLNGSFLEIEKMLPIARSLNINIHAWLWIMNQPKSALIRNHPDWFMVNKEGVSCAEKAPYVGYYRWLCPTKEEARRFLLDMVRPYLELKLLKGIHLDYVRYPDVILPLNLQKKYGLKQSWEEPVYDFCYCSHCRDRFFSEESIDIYKDLTPNDMKTWKRFRYRMITEVVNEFVRLTKKYDKKISAAVFPTPSIALKLVRQDWAKWDLDMVFPMLYHKFYDEKTNWIGQSVKRGMKSLKNKNILYNAGLHLPFFENKGELKKAVDICIENNCNGISLFGNASFDYYGSVLSQYI